MDQLQTNRSCFSRQPARLLLVDLTQPFDSHTGQILVDSLAHFFSLACSLSGSCRLSFFGLYGLGTYPEMLFPLQTIRGNYSRLRNALSELENCLREMPPMGATCQQSCIPQGVHDAVSAFSKQSQNMLQMAGYWTQLELTVLTCQSPNAVLKQVHQSLANISMDILKKAQVLYVNTSGRTESVGGPRQSQLSNSSGQDEDSDGLHGLIECITVEEDVLCLENFFKGWLQDCSTDVEHLHLILPNEAGVDIVLKCDLQERLLSADHLPGVNHMNVPAPSALATGQTGKPGNNNRQQVPVYRLRAVERLNADGVCESVLHGPPVIVQPTSCWKIDWDDLETNQQHFHALCHILREQDQYLLAVSEVNIPSKPPGCGFRYQVPPPAPRGHFVLLPSGGGSLLMKAVGVCELTMPCNAPPADRPSEDSLKAVGHALGKLKECPTYNPLMVRSGLYQYLEALLAKNQPTRGSATKRRLNAPLKATNNATSRPVGQVIASRGCPKKEPWENNDVTSSASNTRRGVSGRDFYSGSEFPTEL